MKILKLIFVWLEGNNFFLILKLISKRYLMESKGGIFGFSVIVSLKKDLFLKIDITLNESVVFKTKEISVYETCNLKSTKFTLLLTIVYRMPTVCSGLCQVLVILESQR